MTFENFFYSIHEPIKKSNMKNNLTQDDVRDIAIRIVDELVKLGYVPDCIDTDDEHEFIVQDIIVGEIEKQLIK